MVVVGWKWWWRVSGALAAVLDWHSALVARGTAHLAPVVDNIMRTSWLASATLHCDPWRAQLGALALLRQLDSVAPAKRTRFEHHLADTEELMENLRSFAHREQAVCLWPGGGAYNPLFQHLALRFLLAPDQVLDWERVHARWQWICEGKHNLRLPP